MTKVVTWTETELAAGTYQGERQPSMPSKKSCGESKEEIQRQAGRKQGVASLAESRDLGLLARLRSQGY